MLRRKKEPLEVEAFLMVDAIVAQVPIGAMVTLQTNDT